MLGVVFLLDILDVLGGLNIDVHPALDQNTY